MTDGNEAWVVPSLEELLPEAEELMGQCLTVHGRVLIHGEISKVSDRGNDVFIRLKPNGSPLPNGLELLNIVVYKPQANINREHIGELRFQTACGPATVKLPAAVPAE